MLTAKLSALGLMLGLGACALPTIPGQSSEPTITFHVDTRFTAPERDCLEVSAGIWRGQTTGLANVKFKYDYNVSNVGSVLENKLNDRLVRWVSTTPDVVEREKREPDEEPWTLLGLADGKVTDVIRTPIQVSLVMDRLEDRHKCILTALHEFGHALGLPHLGKLTDIMYPAVYPPRSACLKHEDLLVFAAINKYPFEQMHPCPNDPIIEISFDVEAPSGGATEAL